jgi:Xaa-Pro aminopeptidase
MGAVTPGTTSGSGRRGLNFGIHAGISPTVWFYKAYRGGAEGRIYIPAENLGVRIEDDVLITDTGPVVLSAGVPKKIEDIEWLMAERIRD